MPDLLSYALDGGVATLAMDDGKVNAMSIPMLETLHAAFDRDPKKSTGSGIYARDAKDGRELWSVDLADRANQVIVANGRLIVDGQISLGTGGFMAVGAYMSYKITYAWPHRSTSGTAAWST